MLEMLVYCVFLCYYVMLTNYMWTYFIYTWWLPMSALSWAIFIMLIGHKSDACKWLVIYILTFYIHRVGYTRILSPAQRKNITAALQKFRANRFNFQHPSILSNFLSIQICRFSRHHSIFFFIRDIPFYNSTPKIYWRQLSFAFGKCINLFCLM